MKRKILTFLVMIPLLISLQGCIYLVVGGVGAVGGYIISPDTVEGITENDSVSVWEATVDVVSIMGIILESDEVSGLVIARVNGAKATISIIELAENKSKVTVRAKKSFLPRISTAQDIFVKIMSQLNE